MKKRMTAILLAVCMMFTVLSSIAVAAAILPFEDVSMGDWFYNAVEYVYHNGIMTGTGETTFSPNQPMSRGMVVTALHRLAGEAEGYAAEFSDVAEGQYYTRAVDWASTWGIVEGYGNGKFGPNDDVTREQLVQILFRYAQYCGDSSIARADLLNYKDADDISDYALDAMQWAVAKNLVEGSKERLDPQGLATRAQFAAILARKESAGLFFGLSLNSNSSKLSRLDCFGRPMNRMEPDYSFTEAVSLQEKLAGENRITSVTTYVDGAENTATDTLETASALTGNGVKTEVFVDAESGKVIIVIIHTYIGRVAAEDEAKNEITLTDGSVLANTENLSSGDYLLYHKCADGAVSSDLAPEPGNHPAAIKVYNAAGVLICHFHDVEKAEPAVETVLHASKMVSGENWLAESYFQTAERKFEYAATYGQFLLREVTLDDLLGREDLLPGDNRYDVYLNEHNYVMWVEKHQEELPAYHYGYFVEDTQDVDVSGDPSVENGMIVPGQSPTRIYAMDVVNYDGMPGEKISSVDQPMKKETWLQVGAFDSADLMGRLGRYIINDKGEIEVLEEDDWAVVAPKGANVVKGQAAISGTAVVTDETTQFMVRTFNWETQTYTYTVYIGYDALPESLFSADNGCQINFLQYLTDGTGLATHVFVDVKAEPASDLFYLLSPISMDTETALYPWLAGYVVYEAIVAGEKAVVALTDEGTGVGSSQMRLFGLYEGDLTNVDGVTVNGQLLYMLSGEAVPAVWQTVAMPANGLLTVDSLASALNAQMEIEAPVYVISKVWEDAFTSTISFRTFDGAERDADLNEFFAYYDFSDIRVCAVTRTISDGIWGTVEEIVELWVEVTID